MSETVYVCKHGSGRKIYHTDEDCARIREYANEWDLELAESWGMRVCKECERGIISNEYNGSYQKALLKHAKNHD